MKKIVLTFAALSAIATAAPAFADDTVTTETNSKVKASVDANGNYKEKATSSQEKTDANGTYTSTDTKTTVKSDANGDGKKSTETTTVNDPKGLFNKTKTVTTDTEKQKDGKSESELKKTVNGKTVQDEKTSTDLK